MKTMRDRFPWLTIPETIQSEIEQMMPQFLLQEATGHGDKYMRCTACGNAGRHSPVAKNRSMGICPFCMEPVEVVDHLKLKSWPGGEMKGLRRHCNVMIFRAVDGILWAIDARAGRGIIRNSFDGPDVYTDMDFYVFSVYRFEPGESEQFHWSCIYDPNAPHGFRWDWVSQTPREPNNQGYMGAGEGTYAVFGLEEAIGQTSCRYSAIEEYFDDLGNGAEVRGVIRYLREWCKRPKLELVVKWGLTDVAKDLVERGRTSGRMVDWRKDTPWEFLKIAKADWIAYRKSPAASAELLYNNRKHFRLTVREALKFAEAHRGEYYWMERAAKLCERGIPFREQIKYLDRQSVHGRFDESARFWLDYLEMAEQLGRDVSWPGGAVMPRSLIEAHDQMVDLRNAMREEQRARELEAKAQNYRKRREQLQKKYAYRGAELEIRVPQGAADIIREGNVLKICVGGYAARHLDGATTILFLRRRRKPDTPYVCIEINEKENRIVQIHGYKNECYTKKRVSPMVRHADFINEWMAWVKAGSHRAGNVRKEATA